MSDNTKQAFPGPYLDSFVGITSVDYRPGMTLREYYAGQAIKGLLADGCRQGLTESAVKIADDLIKELEKNK